MADDGRPLCPFQPNHPVDPSLFVGRADQIRRISYRARQAKSGQVWTVYIGGPAGIGKTSLARYCSILIEQDIGPIGFEVHLGGRSGPTTLKEFVFLTTEGIIQAKAKIPSLMVRIRRFFDKYVEEVSVGCVTVKKHALSRDIPKNGTAFASFIQAFSNNLSEHKDRGLVLVLDELDGIAPKPFFADFLKELGESPTTARPPVRLLLLLCGTLERLEDMRANNPRAVQPMDLVKIEPLADSEVEEFFKRAFHKVGQDLTPDALHILVAFSHGLPYLMHLVGEATYFSSDPDRRVGLKEACDGVKLAAEEFASKCLGQQVRRLLRNEGYLQILKELHQRGVELSFRRKDLLSGSGAPVARQVDTFLQRLRKLQVIEPAGERGEWRFKDRLVRLYLEMQYDRARLTGS